MNLRIGSVMLALGLVAPSLAIGEEVYKSLMPDGSVVYGESAQPGAKKVEKIAAPSGATGTLVVTPQDKNRADSLATRPAPGVGVLPTPARESPRPLETGTMSAPGTMPKRPY